MVGLDTIIRLTQTIQPLCFPEWHKSIVLCKLKIFYRKKCFKQYRHGKLKGTVTKLLVQKQTPRRARNKQDNKTKQTLNDDDLTRLHYRSFNHTQYHSDHFQVVSVLRASPKCGNDVVAIHYLDKTNTQ